MIISKEFANIYYFYLWLHKGLVPWNVFNELGYIWNISLKFVKCRLRKKIIKRKLYFHQGQAPKCLICVSKSYHFKKIIFGTSYKNNILLKIFHTVISCTQLGTNEIVILLILWKYVAYSSCIDHKSSLFKSWYFLNYLVKKLKSFKYMPYKYSWSHWTGKTV